jgi:hypothetical protein
LSGQITFWERDLEVLADMSGESIEGLGGFSFGNFVSLVSVELIDSNTAHFCFSIFVRDVDLKLSAYANYDYIALGSFVSEQVL